MNDLDFLGIGSREKCLEILDLTRTEDAFVFRTKNNKTGEVKYTGGPFQSHHQEFCFKRAQALSTDLVRPSDIDNFFKVANHPRNLSMMREWPFTHQVIGVETLIKHPHFFLTDEMGAGKTKQTIDAAQFMMMLGMIDRVIVLAPASVRSVWFDNELGELAKHLHLPSRVTEFHARLRSWSYATGTKFEWIISNYEFIRSASRLADLLTFCSSKTLLVADESSFIKNYDAAQTQATLKLRRACGFVFLLNGTPIANSPMDLFSQGMILDPRILGCKTYFHFRARYAVMGGWEGKQIVDYQNLEDLQARFKPFVLRRLKKDCLDLPEVLEPVVFDVVLTEKTWKLYKSMRDDMVAWLGSNVSAAQQAAVKTMRLAQITSGFLGGVEDAGIEEIAEVNLESGWFEALDAPPADTKPVKSVEEIGREKLDFLLEWHKQHLVAYPDLKLLAWFRFIPELSRYLREVQALTPVVGCVAGQALLGGSKKSERSAAERLLHPLTAPATAATVGGTYGTGSLGLNFTACHTMIDVSYDYSYWKKLQGDARVDRPGQVHPVSMFVLRAVGPQGQKTIDHLILKVRFGKADVANFVTSDWIKALTEE